MLHEVLGCSQVSVFCSEVVNDVDLTISVEDVSVRQRVLPLVAPGGQSGGCCLWDWCPAGLTQGPCVVQLLLSGTTGTESCRNAGFLHLWVRGGFCDGLGDLATVSRVSIPKSELLPTR